MKQVFVYGVTMAAGLAAAGPAMAGGALGSGAQRKVPMFVNESTTSVSLRNQGSDGYHVKVFAEVAGFGSSKNPARIDWKSKGKVVGTAPCRVSMQDGGAASLTCASDGDPIMAKGDIEAQLIMLDDADDKEYLIHTYRAEARAFEKSGTWQLVADDLLTSAWATHWSSNDGADGLLRLRFWMSGGPTGVPHVLLRCTVDGKPQPDLQASLNVSTEMEADVIPATGARQTWRWNWVDLQPEKLLFGPDAKKTMRAEARSAYRFLSDAPGEWRCMVRHERRNLRELIFTVDSKGMVVSSPLQQAPGAAPLFSNVALIDIRIPKDAGVDQRIRPDVLKKTRMFGQPWPKSPLVAAIHGALPAKIENANPVPPALAKGKVIAGTAHDPKRFVDEPTLQLLLLSNDTGWNYSVVARMAGLGAAGDSVRAEVRQGKKVISTWTCGLSVNRDATGAINCEARDQNLTVSGPLELDLVYQDDQDGNAYVLRTLKFTVGKFPMVKGFTYQVVPDEALGGAWIRHTYPQLLNELTTGKPTLYLWFAQENVPQEAALRCTVDGAKIADLKLSFEPVLPMSSIEAEPNKGKPLHYAWVEGESQIDAYFGKRADYTGVGEAGDTLFLSDKPGAWVCQLRVSSRPVRELRFTVDKKGFITSPLQTAPDAATTLPSVVAIDMRFVKDAKIDWRVRPDKMKKSRAWGLPWPSAPEVKDIHASFPAASGLPDPK